MAETDTRKEHEEAREARRAQRRGKRIAVHADDELKRVKEEVGKILEKKDIHVHNAHEWMHKLGRASKVLLRDHETELDNAEQSSAWVNDALDAITDANKQTIALAKAIVAASGHRVAKDADFDKENIPTILNGITTAVDKALSEIPAEEKKS